MERISVIVPVYNGERTLERLVGSVLAQTYPDFEILLVDDGSTDLTGSLCRELAEREERVRFWSVEHRGVAAARNWGMARAAGECIAFVDADDWIPPDYLEVLHAALGDRDGAVCDLVREGTRLTHPAGVLSGRDARERLLQRQTISTGPCGKLFRREAVAGLEFPPLEAYEDIVFVAEVFRRAGKIAVTDQTAYHYLPNPAGTMARFGKAPPADALRAAELLLAHPMGDGAFYATVSHLLQLARAADRKFRRRTRRLCRRHLGRLLTCPAFPRKERVYYLLYALGLVG